MISRTDTKNMKAMIFAAGLGTRLRPITDRMPKALVPVNGKPLLKIVLDRLVGAGYDDIVVNVHHFADMVEDYLHSLDMENVRVRISDERDFLRDTGGGIRHAGPLLGNGPFLVHNVDIISDMDLQGFAAAFPEGALAALAVSERETSRYLLFGDDMRLVGWTNVSTGEVRSPYPGLDPSRCRKYAFTGIHILSHDVFSMFDAEGFGEKFPIMDFYLKVADRWPVYGVVQKNLHIVDVGKPSALEAVRDNG